MMIRIIFWGSSADISSEDSGSPSYVFVLSETRLGGIQFGRGFLTILVGRLGQNKNHHHARAGADARFWLFWAT